METTGSTSDRVLAGVLSFLSSHTSIGRSRMLSWPTRTRDYAKGVFFMHQHQQLRSGGIIGRNSWSSVQRVFISFCIINFCLVLTGEFLCPIQLRHGVRRQRLPISTAEVCADVLCGLGQTLSNPLADTSQVPM